MYVCIDKIKTIKYILISNYTTFKYAKYIYINYIYN